MYKFDLRMPAVDVPDCESRYVFISDCETEAEARDAVAARLTGIGHTPTAIATALNEHKTLGVSSDCVCVLSDCYRKEA